MNSWAGDGTYWWSKNPKVTNFYFVTYAGCGRRTRAGGARVRGEDEGRRATPAQTGGFITGADAIDAIAYAIKQSGGSTDGAKLAAILAQSDEVPDARRPDHASRRRSTA